MLNIEKRLKKCSTYIHVYSYSNKLMGLIAVKVGGYLFEWNGYDFIIHKSLEFEEGKWYYLSSNGWVISEINTGRYFFCGRTRKDVIKKFEEYASKGKLHETLQSKKYKEMVKEFEEVKKRDAVDVEWLLNF